MVPAKKTAFPANRKGRGERHAQGGANRERGRFLLDHHVLEFLQRAHFDDGGGGLGFEHDFLLGEGIDALACLGRWFVHRADFQQAGQDELANRAFVDMRFDDVGQAIQDRSHLLAAESGAFGNLLQDLSLGESIFDGCKFLGHTEGISQPGPDVKTSDVKNVSFTRTRDPA